MEKRTKELAKFTQKIKTTYLKGVKPDQFIKTLKKKKVDVVVDIRDWSLYPIYFYPKNMESLLKENDIEYLKYRDLGNPSKLRKRTGENFELAKQLYQEHIFRDLKAKESFFDLYKKFRFKKNYCLICYCPILDPRLCHRFWLKELLINLKRIHLGFSGKYKVQNYFQKPIPEVVN